MSDLEPIRFGPRAAFKKDAVEPQGGSRVHDMRAVTTFDRRELAEILALYGRKVAAGEWRDYAIDMGRETAVFSVFRRSCEYPLYRIEKTPKFARRQGTYSVVAPAGLILKRGSDLKRVLQVLEKSVRLVDR